MRGKMAACASALVVACGLAVTAGALAASSKTVKANCSQMTYSQTAPKTTGFLFAKVTCGKPLGSGVQYGTYKETFSGSKITATGTFKNFLDTGMFHGTYTLKGTVAPVGATKVSGPFKVTGGTGAYKHATGKGTLTCSSSDGGKTYKCKTVGKLVP